MSDAKAPRDREEEAGTKAGQTRADETPIEVDVFGVKLKSRAQGRPAEEPDPESWSQVWPSINKHIRTFLVQFFGLLPDTMKSARSLVRGLGALPGALAERIGRAHEQADRQEDALQVEARVVNPITPEKALENAEVVFARLQAKGASVAMRHLPDGQWAVVAVRPELEDSAPDCARAALEGPKEQTLEDKLELTASVEATVVKGASPEAQPQGDDMDDDDIA